MDDTGDEDDLARSTRSEASLDVAAALLPFASLLGPFGAILGAAASQVLAGQSSDWKIKRVVGVLRQVQEDVDRIASAQTEYLRSEDFLDLLDKALRQSAEERHEGLRRLYAKYIAGLAGSEPAPYDERRQLLRTLEELQLRHVDPLLALAGRSGLSDKERLALEHGHSRWAQENADLLDQLQAMGLVRRVSRSTAGRIRTRRNRSGQSEPVIQGNRLYTTVMLTAYGNEFLAFVSPPGEPDLARDNPSESDTGSAKSDGDDSLQD